MKPNNIFYFWLTNMRKSRYTFTRLMIFVVCNLGVYTATLWSHCVTTSTVTVLLCIVTGSTTTLNVSSLMLVGCRCSSALWPPEGSKVLIKLSCPLKSLKQLILKQLTHILVLIKKNNNNNNNIFIWHINNVYYWTITFELFWLSLSRVQLAYSGKTLNHVLLGFSHFIHQFILMNSPGFIFFSNRRGYSSINSE